MTSLAWSGSVISPTAAVLIPASGTVYQVRTHPKQLAHEDDGLLGVPAARTEWWGTRHPAATARSHRASSTAKLVPGGGR